MTRDMSLATLVLWAQGLGPGTPPPSLWLTSHVSHLQLQVLSEEQPTPGADGGLGEGGGSILRREAVKPGS